VGHCRSRLLQVLSLQEAARPLKPAKEFFGLCDGEKSVEKSYLNLFATFGKHLSFNFLTEIVLDPIPFFFRIRFKSPTFNGCPICYFASWLCAVSFEISMKQFFFFFLILSAIYRVVHDSIETGKQGSSDFEEDQVQDHSRRHN